VSLHLLHGFSCPCALHTMHQCANMAYPTHQRIAPGASDRNYTTMHTHVQQSVHLSALLIT
jgi:hypothetical protein